MKNQLINNILIFALVFLLAYILGISIINLINHRLQNIAIKMPNVEVQSPHVTVNLAEHIDKEICGSRYLPRTHFRASTEKTINQSGGSGNGQQDMRHDILIASQGCEGSHVRQTESKPTTSECQTGECSSDWQCNQVYGNGENKCVNGKCDCRYGTGFYCHLQPTYYLDPKLMTPDQIIKFKNKARLDRMTLQDYKNWLSLFTYDLQNLPLIHRKNYWRMKKGDDITVVPLCDNINVSQEPETPVQQTSQSQQNTQQVQQKGSGTGCGEETFNCGIESDCQVSMPPEDVRMYRMWGDRQLGPSGIRPESDDLIEVKLKIPAVEADTAYNYMFTDQHMDTTGYVRNVNDYAQPLSWSNYANAFEPNKKYQEYEDPKLRRFKTTPVASWFQNSAIELSDLVESTYFDPKYKCN